MVVFKQQLRCKAQKVPHFLVRTKNMELHTDFSQRVILHTEQMPWLPSPAAGVERHNWTAKEKKSHEQPALYVMLPVVTLQPTHTEVVKRFLCWRGSSPMNMGTIHPEATCAILPEPLTPLSQSRAASSSSSSGSSILVTHKPSVSKPNRAAGGLDVRKVSGYSSFMNFKASALC